MTSIVGAELDGTTELSRHLAVFPALAGALAVITVFVGSGLADLTETELGQALTVAAGLFILLAMALGVVIGHYIGLAVFVVAVQLAVDARTTAQLIVILVTLIAVHELGRFSLDARRPTRFAPGYLRSFFLRSALVTVLVGVITLTAIPVADLDLPPVLVPVGLALATLPLFVRRLVQAMGDALRSSATARLVVGLFVAMLALGASLVAAQARTGLVNDRANETSQNSTSAVTTQDDDAATPRAAPITLEDNFIERAVSFAVLVLAILVAGLLYAAFRRPEISFELDDLNRGVDHRSLGLAKPGEADLDDYSAAIDEHDMAHLLDGLLLDISAEPDPGRAIRYGYATIERRLAELGVARRESETEQELLGRALPALPGAKSSLVRLTSLFESARFGVDEMTEPLRAEAIEAVRTLRAAVDRPTGTATEGS